MILINCLRLLRACEPDNSSFKFLYNNLIFNNLKIAAQFLSEQSYKPLSDKSLQLAIEKYND